MQASLQVNTAALEEARRKQIEQQRQAATASQNVAQGSVAGAAAVIDRKRFWLLSFVGGVLSWGLVWWIVPGSGGSFVVILFGIIAGLISGYAQWRALRGILAGSWKWIVASAIGLGAGFGLAVGAIGGGIYSIQSQFAILGGSAGLGIGLAQWLVVRRQISGVGWWFVANVGSLALGLSIVSGIFGPSYQFSENFVAVIILTIGCVLHSAVVGWLLPRCLKPLAQ